MKRSLSVVLALSTGLWIGGCSDSGPPLGSEAVSEELDAGGARFAKGGKGKGGGVGETTPTMEALGKAIFEDTNLSLNGNQSCQTCHHPDEGFAAPVSATTRGSVVEGSIPGSFGDRKPPSAAYATQAPVLGLSGNSALGGTFWDGRATGELLGNPAADQALGPFLNLNEQALPSAACVVYLVCTSSYASDFDVVWGEGACPELPSDICDQGPDPSLGADVEAAVTEAYHDVGHSIAAFEASPEVSPYSSRFDAGQLSALERQGAKLFGAKGKCAQCHDDKGSNPLFTDFQYHNLGVPRNPANPVYGMTGFDPGLGGFTGETPHLGKFKTPTIRNAAEGANRTYMHNGSLLTLRQVVQFYNTRDALRVCTEQEMDAEDDMEFWGPDGYGCWPPPEYAENMDTKQMGDLGLSDAEVDAIVAFMEATTDQ
jgi:cytochrome c peroxidase